MIKSVDLYTDGSCLGNPGVGGWASILVYNGIEKEISGYEDNTTNNRMELTAVIKGLEALKEPCRVSVFSDSKYVVDAVNKGWLLNWERSGFKGRLNSDLWETFLRLCRIHDVKFTWVKGHDGNKYNERCDKLAVYVSTNRKNRINNKMSSNLHTGYSSNGLVYVVYKIVNDKKMYISDKGVTHDINMAQVFDRRGASSKATKLSNGWDIAVL